MLEALALAGFFGCPRSVGARLCFSTPRHQVARLLDCRAGLGSVRRWFSSLIKGVRQAGGWGFFFAV